MRRDDRPSFGRKFCFVKMKLRPVAELTALPRPLADGEGLATPHQLSVGHFIFRLNLSLKPKLKPKFSLKPKLIRKIK